MSSNSEFGFFGMCGVVCISGSPPTVTKHMSQENGLTLAPPLFLPFCHFPVMWEDHHSICSNRRLKLRKGRLYVYAARSKRDAAETTTAAEVFPKGPSVSDGPAATQNVATTQKWFEFVSLKLRWIKQKESSINGNRGLCWRKVHH